DERAPVDAAEHHVIAADVHVVRRVARLHVELTRRLRHLLQHALGIELDHVAVHLLPRLAEQLHRLRLGELDPDLGDDPPPAAVQHPDRVGGEDLIPRHRVDEHRHTPSLAPLAGGRPYGPPWLREACPRQRNTARSARCLRLPAWPAPATFGPGAWACSLAGHSRHALPAWPGAPPGRAPSARA